MLALKTLEYAQVLLQGSEFSCHFMPGHNNFVGRVQFSIFTNAARSPLFKREQVAGWLFGFY